MAQTVSEIITDIETVKNYKNAKKEAESERQKIIADMQKTNAEKVNMIKKTLAAQRAKFGAGGAGDGMSKDAVLERMKDETAESFNERLRAAQVKFDSIKKPSIFSLLKRGGKKIDDIVKSLKNDDGVWM